MGADNMMAAKFRVKDRNNQLKNFFEAVFDEDLDEKLPDHPWAKQWESIYRLGDFISGYSKKDLNDCISTTPDRDYMFSLVVVEPDVYELSLTYCGKPTSSDLEDYLMLFLPYFTEEQPNKHLAHYSCDWGDFNVAYVLHEGKIYRSGCIGNREYNRSFIKAVNNPAAPEQWGEPLVRWDKSQEPAEVNDWWCRYEENRYYDFSKLGEEISSLLVWEILE